MEQNETDRHWSTMGGLAELGRSVETVHCLLSFPWPLVLEGLVYMMVSKGCMTERHRREQCRAAAFTSWLHSIHALFQHLPFLALRESYEIVFLFYVAAGLCRGWVNANKLKRTSSWRPGASYFTGTKWHWWILFFLWYWLWGLTFVSPSPTLAAIFYVSFCCHSYK